MYSKDTTSRKYTRYKYVKYIKKYYSFEKLKKMARWHVNVGSWYAFGTFAHVWRTT